MEGIDSDVQREALVVFGGGATTHKLMFDLFLIPMLPVSSWSCPFCAAVAALLLVRNGRGKRRPAAGSEMQHICHLF